jgi:predicted transcriptional regulator
MSTTSLKLPDELKQRAATAAEELGMSTHAFMVDAIRRAADAVEQRSEFVAEALAARSEALHTGLGYDGDDVEAYLRKRITDPKAPRPIAKPWQK